jgi:hypothetical protein
MSNSDEAKRRAEALLFRPTSPESRSAAMATYRAEQQATLDNMVRLRALRMARKAAGGSEQPARSRARRRRRKGRV